MIGGLVTSAFLTLEVIPVLYTIWRTRQLAAARGFVRARAPGADVPLHDDVTTPSNGATLCGTVREAGPEELDLEESWSRSRIRSRRAFAPSSAISGE